MSIQEALARSTYEVFDKDEIGEPMETWRVIEQAESLLDSIGSDITRAVAMFEDKKAYERMAEYSQGSELSGGSK